MMTTRAYFTKTRLMLGTAFAFAMACVLAACGVDQVAGIQGSGSPIAAGATSQGPITGFGSIFLDGVEYVTSSAQIRIDGQSAVESQLRVGYVVTLRGSVNPDGKTGTATEVNFTQGVRGPVSAIDTSASTFTALGQLVQVTDTTLFDNSIQPSDLTGLQVGNTVQVSGFADANGAIVATRVESAGANAILQVKGALVSLDTVAQTFKIGALTVAYSGATVSDALANGSVVTVQGTALSNTGALVATRVDLFRGLGAVANDRGQLEGVITTFTSGSDFVVAGQRVTTDASTVLLLNGVTLGLNVPVKVRGTFNSAGVLVASRVEVKPRSFARIRGLVDSVNAAAGSLTVLGVTITTDSTTSFNDKSDLNLRSFRFADLRTGDYIEARGSAGANGSGLVATLVERDRPENVSYLRGTASNFAAPNFSILGATVAIGVDTQFIGLGNPLDAVAAFFAQAPDRVVKVRGTLVGNLFLADQVQIEN
jgi:hypothetical protein